ncbi:MAG: proline dehydrogenase family protein [Ardenticatenaceae bacterium]|nr:proline dehydrogenase family protein [Ardenticatenaceae bacterium]MCB9444804.1 proline dehydrogenase family protein [Ardenticatenaceae bacterium]
MKQKSTFPTLIFISILLIAAGLLYRFGEQWLHLLLLYLSGATWAREIVSNLPVAQKLALRFVAGETVDDAIDAARALNNQGLLATMDFLGESVTSAADAVAARDEILRLLDRIHDTGVNANVSVKLSQLGLKISPELTHENMRQILERARQHNNKIRIDMEESAVTDATLVIYRKLRDQDGFGHRVGIVIQAYLHRSEEDIRQLVDEGAWVRLCKGAYAEPHDVAFAQKADTDANFIKLTHMMLSPKARQNGVYLGVATHDEAMIGAATSYVQAENYPANAFEFQMLYGIRRELQESLVKKGYQVRVYIPFGTAWYPYFMRRLAERPANLWFFISNYLRA